MNIREKTQEIEDKYRAFLNSIYELENYFPLRDFNNRDIFNAIEGMSRITKCILSDIERILSIKNQLNLEYSYRTQYGLKYYVGYSGDENNPFLGLRGRDWEDFLNKDAAISRCKSLNLFSLQSKKSKLPKNNYKVWQYNPESGKYEVIYENKQ